MKKIIYAGDTLITGDDIAAAVLRSGKALAEVGAAEMVEIPVMDDGGELHVVTLLIGPSSQIVVSDVATGHPELVDEAVVAKLDDLAQQRSPQAVPADEPLQPPWADEL
ncbi:hypothetical protein QL996_02540 [Planococcus sp. APC 4015]|nr:hypothetical protein [Planococcus sp. APC 4015]